MHLLYHHSLKNIIKILVFVWVISVDPEAFQKAGLALVSFWITKQFSRWTYEAILEILTTSEWFVCFVMSPKLPDCGLWQIFGFLKISGTYVFKITKLFFRYTYETIPEILTISQCFSFFANTSKLSRLILFVDCV